MEKAQLVLLEHLGTFTCVNLAVPGKDYRISLTKYLAPMVSK
jgi:hypothetical protein